VFAINRQYPKVYGYESNQNQYKPENKEFPSENVHKTMEFNNNEQLEEFVPKSFVASFGHQGSCSGAIAVLISNEI